VFKAGHEALPIVTLFLSFAGASGRVWACENKEWRVREHVRVCVVCTVREDCE
jgi:hypothetical protein